MHKFTQTTFEAARESCNWKGNFSKAPSVRQLVIKVARRPIVDCLWVSAKVPKLSKD